MIEVAIYSSTFLFIALVLWVYIRKGQRASASVLEKVSVAKELGMFEPVSLYPHINLSACMGSGACITACPEKDIIGIVDSKATIINATSCIGHGACFLACPVDAITLRIGTAERGVELPHVLPDYQSNVRGLFIAGELGGMGLIKNAAEQGVQAMEGIAEYLKITAANTPECDVLIIGAGPAGIAGALKAKELGLSMRIVDRESLGGTVFTFPRQKVVMTQPMELPGHGSVKLVNTTKQELLEIWESALSKFNIEVEEQKCVVTLNRQDDGFEVMIDGGEIIRSKTILLAIGRRGIPRKLGVPGEALPKVTYSLIEPESFQGLDILVVGGGDSAVENALLLSVENRVTLSYRKNAFARIKPDNRTRINEAIEQGKLNVIFNSNLNEILEESVILDIEGKVLSIKNDQVFIFAGGELPNAFLRASGIEVKEHFGKTVRKHKR